MQAERAKALMVKHSDVFSKCNQDFRKLFVKYSITLTDAEPFKEL